MAHLLRMPEVAADSPEAVLQEWSVAENETFSAEDTLATVETEKALVDVEAESAGVILRALVEAGATVAVGAPIAVIADPDEGVTDVDALLEELGVGNGAAPAEESEETEGTAETEETEKKTEKKTEKTEKPSDPDPQGRTEPEPAKAGPRLFISPLARKLAREADLDSSKIVGTGPNGRIRKRDVEAALAEGSAAESAEGEPSAAESVTAPSPGDQQASVGGYTDVPHTRLRRAVASRLSESKRTVPHFYVRGTADVRALIALREELNATTTVKVSFNDLLLKAAAVAHRRHPQMNVIWTDDAVRNYDQVDISVAIASERGLVTPVLRGVDMMPVTEVARAVRDVVERANAGKLKQDELEGGTFSLSNLGMFGTEEFSAIINPPQAALLAVGAIREEPVVRKGKLKVGRVVHFVLSVDHRSVDGAIAADWMRTFLAVLESPLQILA